MTNKKYIIRNCPCNVTTEDMCDWENTNETYCQDCTDCLLKQIVEKCRLIQDKKFIKGNWKFRSPSKAKFGREILELLDIQEVE